jgi:hypothetical protein
MSAPGAPVVTQVARGKRGDGSLLVELNGRRYKAWWVEPGNSVDLNVRVNVWPATNGGSEPFTPYVECLNLYSAISRQKFGVRAAKRFNADAEAIEADLSELLVIIDRAQHDAKAAALAEAEDPAPKMSNEERRAALELLEARDLMDRIAADMETLGYVGEAVNKKLVYIIGVSRKMAAPLNGTIISQSGAGKSQLVALVRRLTPPEDVLFLSDLTPEALYYFERNELSHKLIIIEEREGQHGANYPIRVLQSEGRIVKALPLKDPATGLTRTVTLEVEGPDAVLETATQPDQHPENVTRLFEIYLDESREQTERIHRAQREAITFEGKEHKAAAPKLEHLHHNAQRLLEQATVFVPYARLLDFPKDSTRTRRDNARLNNLIEAVAFLHQKQRSRKQGRDGEYIEANLEDYAIAYELAAHVFAYGLDELKKPTGDLLALVEKKARELAELRGVAPMAVTFTRREVRQWSGLPNHEVKRAMRELEELEYLEAERGRRGSRFFYRLVTDRNKEAVAMRGMLTPVELFNKIAAAESAADATKAGARKPAEARPTAGGPAHARPAASRPSEAAPARATASTAGAESKAKARPAPALARPAPGRERAQGKVEQSGKKACSTHFSPKSRVAPRA